ncbi:MAG: TolC family protein [Flavobacteriales bacterium]|nr:TolC family protein [Flavobacteriales bacterium]
MRQAFFPCLLGFLLLLAPRSSAQEAWSLQRCLDHAREHNMQLKQSMLNRQQAEYGKSQALAMMFPDLNANVGGNINFGRSIDPGTNSFVNEQVNANNFGIGSNVTLFNGLRLLNSFKQAQIDVLAANYDLEGLVNDISMNIASAFLQVMFNEELLRVSKEQLASTTAQVDRTRKLVDAGAMPMGNLLDVESQMAAQELRVVNAENAIQTSLVALQQLLNIRAEDGFSIQRPPMDLPVEDLGATTVQSVYDKAMENWPQIKAQETKLESARKGERIAFSGYTPTLRASGNVSTFYSSAFRDFNAETLEFEDVGYADQVDRNLSQSVSLNLSIPIFNGLQARTAVRRSHLTRINAELQLQDTRNQLYSSVQQAYNDAMAANRQYEAGLKSVSASERAYAYAEQRHAVGAINDLDLSIGRNNLAIAQSDLLRAKYEYIFRAKILDFYQGIPLAFPTDK